MQLSLKSEYAIRTMLHLAAKPAGDLAQISHISGEWNIPESFLRKVIPVLTRSGLISSRRGHKGGITLKKAATSITLLEVIEAMEGPLYINKCMIGPQSCNHAYPCAVHWLWSEAQESMKRILQRKSIAELVTQSVMREKGLNQS